MLLVTRCPICGTPGRAPCRPCEADLPPPPSLALPPGLDAVWAICAYDDAGRSVVHALKYGNHRAVARWAADRLATGMRELGRALPPHDWCLTWAPTSADRRRSRGFDQAERLARLLGRRVGVRPRSLLARAPGPPQTGQSARDRWSGPSFATVRGSLPDTVVVVDDVVTTGATASASARALRSGGVRHVWVLAVARTSFKPRGPRADAPCNASDQHPGRSDPGVVVS